MRKKALLMVALPLSILPTFWVIYELGYGGQVTDLSETSVTVKTNVMDCVDTTIFSVENDKKDELKPFFEFIAAHNQIKSIKSLKEKNIDQVMKVTKGQANGKAVVAELQSRRN